MEVWEHQRRWVGLDFSSSTLLPTDRAAFSTRDGALGFATLDEAEEGLLGQGWKWEEGGFYPEAPEGVDTDANGFIYDTTDFTGAVQEAVATPGVAHFVRRRR